MKPLGYFSKVHSHLAIHLAVRSGPYFFSQHKGDFFIKHGKSKEEVTWGKKRKKKKRARETTDFLAKDGNSQFKSMKQQTPAVS